MDPIRTLDQADRRIVQKGKRLGQRKPDRVAIQLLNVDRAPQLAQVGEAIAALGEHEVVPHLMEAGEAALMSLDWPSDTQNYVARTAPSGKQQKIWQLPELKDSPDGLNDTQRDSVTKAPLSRNRSLSCAFSSERRSRSCSAA